MNEFYNEDGDGWDEGHPVIEALLDFCENVSNIEYLLKNCTIESAANGRTPEKWLQDNVKVLKRDIDRIKGMIE